LYSLLRQLGYASGVALMSAVLQSKISTHLTVLSRGLAAGAAPSPQLAEAAALQGYADCFTTMAIAAAVIIPGIFLFRTGDSEAGAHPLIPGP